MSHWVDQLRSQADREPWLAVGVGAVVAAVAGVGLWWLVAAARRGMRGRASSVLITIAALMATAVQSAGMWKFFASTMALPLGLRIFLFSFMEVALLACGTRAKENVRAGEDAGIDGVLVVVLALGSGVLAATDASSWQEVLVRLMVSIVAALLWERDLLATKYAARQDGKRPETIRWRFGWKTLAVRWGWADAGDASLADQGANRVFDQFVKATHAVNRLDPESRQRRRALERQATAQARLMSYARLNTDLTQLMRTLGEVATSEGLTMLGVEQSGSGSEKVPERGPDLQLEPDLSAKPMPAPVPAPAPVLMSVPEAVPGTVPEPESGPVPVPVPAPRAAEPWMVDRNGRTSQPHNGAAHSAAGQAGQAVNGAARVLSTNPDTDVDLGENVPDLRSARLARQIVGRWPEETRLTQRAFLLQFRKHRPISNKEGAALYRYATGAADSDDSVT
ncbi:MAG: hypothetical protein HOV87_09285 [Catenulispora sp.]|nr:hypothetical protein [Catenulispora sp.]